MREEGGGLLEGGLVGWAEGYWWLVAISIHNGARYISSQSQIECASNQA